MESNVSYTTAGEKTNARGKVYLAGMVRKPHVPAKTTKTLFTLNYKRDAADRQRSSRTKGYHKFHTEGIFNS